MDLTRQISSNRREMMMQPSKTPMTMAYSPGEALTTRMTAEEWTAKFEPQLLHFYHNLDECIREIANLGDQEAQRLNIAPSATGHYPPVVWELVALRNR